MPIDGSNPEGLLPEDVEKCVLGCMMLFDQAADYALAELTEEDFFVESHVVIFRVMQILIDEGTPLDVMTLAEKLTDIKRFELAGGAHALAALMEIVPHAEHVRYYCRIVKTNSERRKLKNIAFKLRGMTGSDLEENIVFDVRDTVAWIETQLADLSGIRKDGLKTMREGVAALRNKIQERHEKPELRLNTGFSDIDHIMKIYSGQFIVLGARPGMGKTALVGQVMQHVAETTGHCLYISLEMDDSEIAGRLCGTQLEFADAVENLPILISDTEYDFDKICSLIRMSVRRNRVKLVVIDYLQLIDLRGNFPNDEAKVAHMSKTFKRLARTLKIPIVAVVQLNRDLEKRDDKRPRVSDIRGSGAIEQDADIIGFLYRDVVYNKDADPGEAEFILAKQRSGASGRTIKLGWHGAETRFSDWSMRPIDDEGLFTEQHFGEGVDLP